MSSWRSAHAASSSALAFTTLTSHPRARTEPTRAVPASLESGTAPDSLLGRASYPKAAQHLSGSALSLRLSQTWDNRKRDIQNPEPIPARYVIAGAELFVGAACSLASF